MEGWTEFFLGELGAAAALAGLLVVAISINIERIVANPILPARAAQTVTVIGSAVVVSSFALFPRQPLSTFGWESVATGVVLLAAGLIQARGAYRRRKPGDPMSWTTVPIALVALVAALLAVGGILLVGGNETGIYWIAVSVIASMAVTLINGWVLLIEILR